MRVRRRTGAEVRDRKAISKVIAVIAPRLLVSLWTASATLGFDRAFKFPTCNLAETSRMAIINTAKCSILKADVAVAILMAFLCLLIPSSEPRRKDESLDTVADSSRQNLSNSGHFQMSDDGSWTLAGSAPFSGVKSQSCEVHRPSSSRPSTVYNTIQKPRYQGIGPLLFEQDRNEHPANKANDSASEFLPSPLNLKTPFLLDRPGLETAKAPSPLSRNRSAPNPRHSKSLVPRRLSIRRPNLPATMAAATVASSVYSQSSDEYDGSIDGNSTSSEGDLATASAFTFERVLHPQSQELPRSRGATKTSRSTSGPGMPLSELQAYVQNQQSYYERHPLPSIGSPLSTEYRRRSSSLPSQPPQIKHSPPDYPFLSIDPASAKQPPNQQSGRASIDTALSPPIATKSPYEHLRKESSLVQFPASSGGRTELDRRLAEAAANADATAGSRRRSLSGERRKVTKKRQPHS
ncbi:uncharacterized protein KY384_005198 [Bacidia gigantensis]|uniref:uncharacterized protein n=1 Tax=Bacidia gigantensis TaxID=2732470 RepID=UPI001D05A01F|nr:uncharacterized protein KY384_005198 [Bacidia gigantensis]KAG8529717.1 hypothetical protein KY384_005198 [Bacidia gigantensis]